MEAPRGYLFLDACGFELEARRKNRFLDFDALCRRVEVEFGCVLAEKHYFNSVENPHEQSDYLAKLERMGWTTCLFAYKTVSRRVTRGGDNSFVRFTSEDGSSASPAPGVYEITVQAGVDTALATAMTMLHGQVESSAVFILIASDGDFLNTLSRLRDKGRSVFVLFWQPSYEGHSANLAAKLTKFLKSNAETRTPGESVKHLYLDDILTTPFVPAWTCSCGFSNKAGNYVCGGDGALGCKAKRIDKPENATEWVCRCGWRNSALNDKCGGTGEYGCKAERPPSLDSSAALPEGTCKLTSSSSTGWKCRCGWVNSASNEKCGGTGDLGCKQPRPNPLRHHGDTRAVTALTVASHRSTADEWRCDRCGWENKATNTVCGGTGDRGCKAVRPTDWTCLCGFANKAINSACGGNGKLGCKKPRPSIVAAF